MEYLIQFKPLFCREDLDRVQAMLRAEDPFVSGVPVSDPYDVLSYLPRQALEEVEFCLLLDRNVVTRLVGVLNGRRVNRQHRVSAGILAFAQASDLMLEPNIAFYEAAAQLSEVEIEQELSSFYAANSGEVSEWLDVALGRRSEVESRGDVAAKKVDGARLKKPLYRWQRNYVLALRIAELHLAGGSPLELMERLMEWMYRDFLIGGPALQLASHYFAPGAPRRGLLKHIESPDRDRALLGVRNAAWDLTLVSEWLNLVQRNDGATRPERFYTLCTLDKAVKRMAQDLVTFEAKSGPEDEQLFNVFHRVWGQVAARRLAGLLGEYQTKAADQKRQLHQVSTLDFINEMISKGEEAVRGWRPVSAGVRR